MSEIYATGAAGQDALMKFLIGQGREVVLSDRRTFDLVVDGRYAEVKSSLEPYAKLGFIGLTENQYKALKEGPEFSLFLVCNLNDRTRLEVIEIQGSDLLKEDPTVESTYYWSRTQLQRIRGCL